MNVTCYENQGHKKRAQYHKMRIIFTLLMVFYFIILEDFHDATFCESDCLYKLKKIQCYPVFCKAFVFFCEIFTT